LKQGLELGVVGDEALAAGGEGFLHGAEDVLGVLVEVEEGFAEFAFFRVFDSSELGFDLGD